MDLDPNDTRPPYQQVAGVLRAAILTGTYQPGAKIPSGQDLSADFGVARMTIQQAIRILRSEGLVISRQGTGVFVRDRTQRPIELRPHVEEAFEAENVRIDFAGFSSETLQSVLAEPLDKVRAGRLSPESVSIRLLLPDTSEPMRLPCRAEDLQDDPGARARSQKIQHRQISAMMDTVSELSDMGLIKSVSIEIRLHALTPLFKLFVLNNTNVFFGFYPVRRREISIDNAVHDVFDLGGKDAVLFRYQAEETDGAPFVSSAMDWFTMVWSDLSWQLAHA